MKKKIIVWDLFGGLNGSVGLALMDREREREIETYTLDILPQTKDGRDNIVANLANENYKELKEILDTLPKPDIIVASPMCMTWSRASAMKGGSTGWIINEDDSLSRRPKEHFEDKDINGYKDFKAKGFRYKYDNNMKTADLGQYAIENTIRAIEEYKPKVWYIENPAGSLMWRYIKHNIGFKKSIKNLVHYGAYGAINKKPTIFLSNIELDLRLCPKNWVGYKGEGASRWEEIPKKDRSDIPKDLINETLDKFIKVIDNE